MSKDELDIDIEGVTAHTKLGDLTVKQYVELLKHIVTTVPAMRRTPAPEEMREAIEQVRKVITEQKQGQPYYEIVKQTQEAILGHVPSTVKGTQAGGHDAGGSPATKKKG